jgi:1-acyl-sn-glycerol-3-phosphate acyltransferase
MRLLYPLINLLQVLALAVWSVFWITAAMVVALVTRSGEVPLLMARHLWSPLWWRITGSTFTVEPLPDIDWSQPHIFAMNHQSALDIPCAFAALPVNLRFIAKHVLRWVPFLGWYMEMTGMIFINRSNRREAVLSLRKAGERIRAGSNILVFPEGTRSKDGRIQPFKKGPFLLALEAQVPIVPVAIEGAWRALPTGTLRMRPHAIRLKVGQPIRTAGRTYEDRDALLKEVRAAIVRLHQELGGEGGVGEDIAAPGVEGLGRDPDAARHADEPSAV